MIYKPPPDHVVGVIHGRVHRTPFQSRRDVSSSVPRRSRTYTLTLIRRVLCLRATDTGGQAETYCISPLTRRSNFVPNGTSASGRNRTCFQTIKSRLLAIELQTHAGGAFGLMTPTIQLSGADLRGDCPDLSVYIGRLLTGRPAYLVNAHQQGASIKVTATTHHPASASQRATVSLHWAQVTSAAYGKPTPTEPAVERSESSSETGSHSAPGWLRSSDLRVFSAALYQLSYRYIRTGEPYRRPFAHGITSV